MKIVIVTRPGPTQSAAVSGRHPPKDVIEILGRSDVLNCQHSIVELVTTSYAQKSSLWDLYGKVQMSCVVSQLLLNLDTSERARDGGIFFTAEASALALCTLAKYLQDNGCSKACDKILGLSKKLFPNEASVSGQLWSFTKLQVDYERALMLADWKSAEELSSTSGRVTTLSANVLFFSFFTTLFFYDSDLFTTDFCYNWQWVPSLFIVCLPGTHHSLQTYWEDIIQPGQRRVFI